MSKDALPEQKEVISMGQNDVKLEGVNTEHYLIANGMTRDSCVKLEAINTRFKGSGTDNDMDVKGNNMNYDRNLKNNENRIQNNNTRKRERMSHNVSIYSKWTLVIYRPSISTLSFYFLSYMHASQVGSSELLFRWPKNSSFSRKYCIMIT